MDNRHHTPSILTSSDAERTIAPLASILAYHGCWMPLDQLMSEAGMVDEAVSASGLVRAAQHYGLIAKGWRKNSDSLRTMQMPCILHWKKNHFVVLEDLTDDVAYLNDSYAGHQKLSLAEFDKAYSGIVLTFEPDGEVISRGRQLLALSIVLGRMGVSVSLGELLKLAKANHPETDRAGFTAADIKSIAESYGITCAGYNKKIIGTDSCPSLPCIIYCSGPEPKKYCFLVLESFNDGYVWIYSPYQGKLALTEDELIAIYRGVVLTFKKC